MISFGLNFSSKSGTVSDSTYIAFICIMAFGCLCALALLNPYNVIREDNSRAAIAKKPSVWEEFMGLLKVLRDWRVVSLVPFWMAANCKFYYLSFTSAFSRSTQFSYIAQTPTIISKTHITQNSSPFAPAASTARCTGWRKWFPVTYSGCSWTIRT